MKIVIASLLCAVIGAATGYKIGSQNQYTVEIDELKETIAEYESSYQELIDNKQQQIEFVSATNEDLHIQLFDLKEAIKSGEEVDYIVDQSYINGYHKAIQDMECPSPFTE